jgi:hypothetical protein
MCNQQSLKKKIAHLCRKNAQFVQKGKRTICAERKTHNLCRKNAQFVQKKTHLFLKIGHLNVFQLYAADLVGVSFGQEVVGAGHGLADDLRERGVRLPVLCDGREATRTPMAGGHH